jgi:hypothetical protein
VVNRSEDDYELCLRTPTDSTLACRDRKKARNMLKIRLQRQEESKKPGVKVTGNAPGFVMWFVGCMYSMSELQGMYSYRIANTNCNNQPVIDQSVL